jgi:hypothetical protein
MRTRTPRFASAARTSVRARRHEVRRHEVERRLGLADRGQQRREQQERAVFGRVERLARIVAHEARLDPFERKAIREQRAHLRRLAQRLEVGRGVGIRARRGERGLEHRLPVRGRRHERRDRVRRRTVPVQVERGRHVAHDRPDRDDVEVGELDALARAVVLVADVAAADDRDLVVGRERLVVHAPVDALEVGDEVERARVAVHERVVETHLDVGMRVDRGEARVLSRGGDVVEQKAHAHAARGRAPQRLEHQRAGLVVVPDVVLHVERAVRRLREEGARGERVGRRRQRIDARAAGVRRDVGHHGAAEARRAVSADARVSTRPSSGGSDAHPATSAASTTSRSWRASSDSMRYHRSAGVRRGFPRRVKRERGGAPV